jgi:ubiquinone/menaquinone biosynthesis C-methylase UbiE
LAARRLRIPIVSARNGIANCPDVHRLVVKEKANTGAEVNMKPDYNYIFRDQAEKYDRLVSAEDYQGNLVQTLTRLSELDASQSIADLGTGTGRIAFLLAPYVRQVYGIEPVSAMLEVARSKKHSLGVRNVDFLRGEHKAVPLPNGSVDLVVEGWAFLRAFKVSDPEWRSEFTNIAKEMKRILKPGGTVVLIETMGTLHIWKEAAGKNAELYDYFEKELHLEKIVIRTDYKFSNLDEAVDLMTFFFGDETGAEVREIGDAVVPEATAVWHGRL